MKIWLEEEIGDAVRECSARAQNVSGPALSCEATHLPVARAKALVLGAIRELEQDVLIGFFQVGTGRRERVQACLLDMAEVERIIDGALNSEEVVSLRDPSALGGCTFDFSPDEVQGDHVTVELLVTAWGIHETMVKRLGETLGASTFRQGAALPMGGRL